MAQLIQLKRASTQGKVPLTTDLELGELAVNTYDGKVFMKKDDGTESIVTLGSVTSVALSVPTGLSVSGSPITSSGTLAISLASGYSIPTTASQTNWDTAYTDRLKWDGGSTDLNAATARTSLGATTVGGNVFTLTNPSAITFLRINADNTVSALAAADFRTAIGAGTLSAETDTLATVTGRGATTSADISITSSTASTTTTTGALVVTGGVGIGGNANVGGNLVVTGNLTINGITTTVNSTTVTIEDPIFTLGGVATPTVDDNKDRGIEFKWHNGTAAKVGFFGFDDSTGKFTFVPDATNTSEVFAGTKGTLDAKLEWADLLSNPATTVGSNLYALTNPSAITFLRINADNTVSALAASDFRTAIGAGTGNGTVTSVSVASANGFAGTVATDTTTPAITISTSVTGLLKGNGTAISAAVAGTDYLAPTSTIDGGTF